MASLPKLHASETLENRQNGPSSAGEQATAPPVAASNDKAQKPANQRQPDQQKANDDVTPAVPDKQVAVPGFHLRLSIFSVSVTGMGELQILKTPRTHCILQP